MMAAGLQLISSVGRLKPPSPERSTRAKTSSPGLEALSASCCRSTHRASCHSCNPQLLICSSRLPSVFSHVPEIAKSNMYQDHKDETKLLLTGCFSRERSWRRVYVHWQKHGERTSVFLDRKNIHVEMPPSALHNF